MPFIRKNFKSSILLTIVLLSITAIGVFPSTARAAFPADEVYGQLESDGETSTFTQAFEHNTARPNAYGFFNSLASVVADTQRNHLFVSDQARILVYEIESDGSIDTTKDAQYVLGKSDFTSTSVTGPSANTLGSIISGMAIDESRGLLFVSDLIFHRVLVYDISGGITNGMNATAVLGQSSFNAAGYSGLTDSAIGSPRELAVDTDGDRLFVSTNDRVMVFDIATISNGESAVNVLGHTNFTGTITNTEGEFGTANGLAYDNSRDYLYVADDNSTNDRVLVFDVASITNGEDAINVIGQNSLTTYSNTDNQSSFSQVDGIAYNQTTQQLAVTDGKSNISEDNSRVLLFELSSITNGEDASNVLGQPDFDTFTSRYASPNSFSTPSAVHYLDSETLLVFSSHSIRIFDISAVSNGEDAIDVLGQRDFLGNVSFYSNAVRSAVPTKRSFAEPSEIAIDENNQLLFVVEDNDNTSANDKILVFNLNSDGTLVDDTADFIIGASNITEYRGDAITTQQRFSEVGDILVDSDNNRLFVSDPEAHRVLVFDTSNLSDLPSAAYVLGQSSFTANSSATTADGMNAPYGLGYDATNQWLFVGEDGNNRVSVFDLKSGISNGMNASVVLGSADFTTAGDCSSATAKNICDPYDGMAFDTSSRKLYVPDGDFNRVLVFDIPETIGAFSNNIDASNVLGTANLTTDGSSNSAGKSTFSYICEVALGDSDDLYAHDCYAGRILVFDVEDISDGEDAVAVIGQDDFTSTATGTSQELLGGDDGDIALSTLRDGIYIADTENSRVIYYQLPSLNAQSINGTLGKRLDATLTTVGADGSSSFNLVSGSLPPGVIRNGRQIGGTLTDFGTYNTTFRLTDTYSGFGSFFDRASLLFSIPDPYAWSGSPSPRTKTDSCTTAAPVGIAEVFEAFRGKNSVQISFTPVNEADSYAIYYGPSRDMWEHGTIVDYSSDGVIQQRIYEISSDQEMSFQVQPLRGCAAGDPGNVYTVTANADDLTQQSYSWINDVGTSDQAVSDDIEDSDTTAERNTDRRLFGDNFNPTTDNETANTAVSDTQNNSQRSLLGRLLSPLRELLNTAVKTGRSLIGM